MSKPKTLEDVLAENSQMTADLATAKQTIASLQGQVASLTSERNALQAKLPPPTALAQADTKPAAKGKLSLTEQCKLARGIK